MKNKYKIIISLIFGVLVLGNAYIYAQTSSIQDDCAMDINTTKIAPSSSIEDYGIVNYSDLLYIYNTLRQNCDSEDADTPIASHSYIELLYTTIIKDKFLLDIKEDSYKTSTPIIADPLWQARYDKKIQYYQNNKWLNPEIIKEDFDNLWKFGEYNYDIDNNTCEYSWDSDKWLYDKLYNTCAMVKCMRDKITLPNQNATIIKTDYSLCNLYVDEVMSSELNRMTDLVINYAAKMTNMNFDSYANKYFWSKMDKINAVNQKMDWFIKWLIKKITDFTHSCMW